MLCLGDIRLLSDGGRCAGLLPMSTVCQSSFFLLLTFGVFFALFSKWKMKSTFRTLHS
jgi:hypothetical protein